MNTYKNSIKPLLEKEFLFRSNSSGRNKEGTSKISVGYPVYDVDEVLAVLDCVLDLRLSQGEKTLEFEKKFSQYIDQPYAVAVNSGSSANLLALNALMDCDYLRPGDEVILPSSTFATVSSPVYQLGLVPVYVEIDDVSWCIKSEDVEKAISERTKLIMVVHNLGFPADMDKIMSIANRYNINILEDCCEAHGAVFQGKKVGSFGLLSTLSFFVAHNITTGEGGMVFTKSPILDESLRSLREFGRLRNYSKRFYSDSRLKDYDSRYIFTRLGYNVRMTDIIASLGLVQLGKLDALNLVRKKNAQALDRELSAYEKYIKILGIGNNCSSAYYGYPIAVKRGANFTRRDLCEYLESNNIETRSMMGGCLPDQPGFADLKHRIHGELIYSRYVRDNAFFIGCHSGITDQGLQHVVDVFKKFFSGVR